MDAAVVGRQYAAHRDRLFSYLVAFTRDPDAADDLVQDSYVRLARELANGREPKDCRAWLHRVGRNLAVSAFRRSQLAERKQPLADAGRAAASPEDACLVHETEAELGALLRELSDIDRRALAMRAAGYSVAEIAHTLSRSEGAIRTRICRARATLRSLRAGIDLPTARRVRSGPGA